MSRTKRLTAAASVLCVSAVVACAPTSEAPSVAFGSSAPIGRWQPLQSAAQADAAMELPAGNEAPSGSLVPVNNVAGRAAPAAPKEADAGTPKAVDAGSSEPAPASQPSAGSAAPAAGSGGAAAPVVTADPALTSLTFEVTTSAAGGRYQPKNIGAIWIEDGSGAFVKTLQVWAGTRRRYLTGYLGALAGGSVDVTASATLARHQTHSVSWDLKDRSGAVVKPGAYRVRMELTDGNQTGRSNAVDLDSSQGPATLTPADAPSFAGMKLTLK